MIKFIAFCIAMGMLCCYGWEQAAYKAAEWSHNVSERGKAIRAEIRRRYPEPEVILPSERPKKRKLVPLWPKEEPKRRLTEEQWRELSERGERL